MPGDGFGSSMGLGHVCEGECVVCLAWAPLLGLDRMFAFSQGFLRGVMRFTESGVDDAAPVSHSQGDAWAGGAVA